MFATYIGMRNAGHLERQGRKVGQPVGDGCEMSAPEGGNDELARDVETHICLRERSEAGERRMAWRRSQQTGIDERFTLNVEYMSSSGSDGGGKLRRHHARAC